MLKAELVIMNNSHELMSEVCILDLNGIEVFRVSLFESLPLTSSEFKSFFVHAGR
jgi:hypothetical protein